MENRAFALATGVFVIGLIVAAALAGNWLAGAPLKRTTYRVIALQPVTGLNPQGQVRYRGIGAGRVARIELDAKDSRRILVEIEVDDRIPITRGTYAQLGQEGITGIAYVHLLDEGKDAEPPKPASDGVVEIPLRASFFDELFDSAGGIAKDVRELAASMNALLTESNRQDIAATLASAKQIAANLEGVSRRLPTTLARAERFVSEENRRATAESLASINSATRELNSAAKEFPALARDAKQLVEDARLLASSVNRLADDARGATGSVREQTLPRVHALAESVERGAERIGRLASEIERRPDSMLWGRPAGRPGPGEPGFK